jgi:lipid-A-disaccharide synthase
LAPDIPIIDYVSPTVWVWRPGRARTMRGYIDQVLALLPFEPEVHRRLGGPPCVYVGHPAIERIARLRPNAGEARRRLADPPILLVLPGSRRSELRRLGAIFGETVRRTMQVTGPLELVIPTIPELEAEVKEQAAKWPGAPRIVTDPVQRDEAFRTAQAALAKSGTVTLELALAGVPMIGAYKLSAAEALILRFFVALARPTLSTRSVILANLVLDDYVVPEFLQHGCTPDRLAAALVPLLADTPARRRQLEAFARLDSIMEIGATTPSQRAAQFVLELAHTGRPNQ